MSSIPGLGKSLWSREWQSTPVFIPGKFHGQRSLAVYSSWGCNESDTTEWLSAHKDRLRRGKRFHRCQRRHQSPGSETKDFITHGTASNISFRLELVPLFLKYFREIRSGPGRYWAHSGFMLQQRKPEFKKPTSFRGTASWPTQRWDQRETLSSFSQIPKKICPLPWKETLFLSPKAICFIIFCKKDSWKDSLMRSTVLPAHKTCQNTKDVWRIFS